MSLFFVLSGLVLSIRHFRETPQPRLAGFDYLGFLVGRVCRIGLPYWAVLVASAALWHWSGIHAAGGPPVTKWSADLWQHRPTVGGVARQANLSNLDAGYELVPQAWTLAIEVVLSALVPAAVLVAAGGTGVAAGRDGHRLPVRRAERRTPCTSPSASRSPSTTGRSSAGWSRGPAARAAWRPSAGWPTPGPTCS